MKDKQTQMWIPLYVDKWIFGSTRIELEPAERGVFIDLMVLAAKDAGFIRANETTPYLAVQIAGLLNIPVELLSSTLAKCKHFGKMEEPAPGIYRLLNWEKYQFTDRYKRILSSSSEKTEQVFQNSEPIRENKIEEDNTPEAGAGDFLAFWQKYPKKSGRAAALDAWKKKNPPIDKCLATLTWQITSDQWKKDGGRFIPKPAAWLEDGCWDDVPDTHNLVVCTQCGHEGILKKDHTGMAACGRCGALNPCANEFISMDKITAPALPDTTGKNEGGVKQ